MKSRFRFITWPRGVWAGALTCDYNSEQFHELISAGYNWENPHHYHRGRQLSLNWLNNAEEFQALVSKHPDSCE